MRKSKKQRRIMFLLILILGITIGFALLSTTLLINGTAGIKKNTWDIHWDSTSVVVNPTSVGDTTPSVIGTNDNTVEFETTLELPGEFYEFTVDAINEGTIDGEITLSEKKAFQSDGVTETTLPDYIKYTVTYDDGNTPAIGDILKASESKTYKIRVEYDSEATTIPSSDRTYKLKYTVTYEQHTSTTTPDHIPEPNDFSTDTWETIDKAVDDDNLDKYDVGDTKEIEFDADGDGTQEKHYLRIVNKSTPDECLNENFSQTACGFVLEFIDIITPAIMNPYTDGNSNGDGNYGGWQYSQMRGFVNNTIYNRLPEGLRTKIINTKVISGHGKKEVNNFTTIDKMYLPGTREIVLDIDGSTSRGNDSYDTAYNDTRQFDYYHELGIEFTSPLDSHDEINKESEDQTLSSYWLRSPFGNTDFCTIIGGAIINVNSDGTNSGIAPTFRLGKDWVLTNSKTPIKEQKWEYYLNPKLKLQNGWYQLKDFSNNDQWYFFENGYAKLGWYTDGNNNTYYLSELDIDGNGYADANRVHSGTINIDGTDYTFDSNGVCTNCN